MITQIVYLTVKENNLKAFLTEVQVNARESLKEPGVLRFDVLRGIDDPEQFVLYEVYESQEALAAHRLTAHFKRWQETGVPLLAGPRQRVLYEPITI
jgi:(4S)-4-hydroxy-5-phosphonooxypentane-2,3-dione isomerase